MIRVSQEEGNIPYVVDNNVGAYERHPKGIANVLKEWFTVKQDVFKEMSQKAKALGRPEVCVEDIGTN